MTPIVVTPGPLSVDEVANLSLSDGTTDLNLLGTPPWGIYLVEFTPPVVPRENTYVPGPEGQRRVRSRPQNATGNARIRIDRNDDTSITFAADVDSLQGMVESAHKRKGTLTFTPPNLQEVTYDIESCQITESPADGPRMTRRILEFVIEFECKPYGRLATETLLTGEALTGPIDGVEIPVVNGHVDALAELTLTDTSSATSDFVEFAIGQQGYDPDAPLLIDASDLVTSGFTGSLVGSVVEAPLSDEAQACCGTDDLPHGGRQKISVLLGTEEDDVWVRFAYRIDNGAFSYGRWVEVLPDATDLRELTLAVIDMGGSTNWDGEIEAFQGAGSGTLFIHELYVIPAEVCGRIRMPGVAAAAMSSGKSTRFTHEGGFRQQTGATLYARMRLDGDTLRIPASTAAEFPALLVVRRRTNDIDSGEASAGRDDDVTVTLEITPRVALY